MNESNFLFSLYLKDASDLRGRLISALQGSSDEKVNLLLKDIQALSGDPSGDGSKTPPLTVAFVGQYDAGKSSIISAITNRTDIPIDADVCTGNVTAYDWNGIRIIDTPGIHAGYPDHDALTNDAIDKSDLLVYTITNELFDDLVGTNFREIAFENNKAREILLVVNKMGQDPGTPEVKREDLEKVTSPLTIEDFRTVFIDALSYLEAHDTLDETDKYDLLEIANFDDLFRNLNEFVQDEGLTGRLTSPLFIMRAVSQQAHAYVSTDMPQERAALELLCRKRGILLSSKARIRASLSGIVSSASSELIAIGDNVAESIEPESTEEKVKNSYESAQRSYQARCVKLAEDAKSATEEELKHLEAELEALQKGTLATELKAQISRILDSSKNSTEDVKWDGQTGNQSNEWLSRLNKASDIAGKVGKFAAKWASGPMSASAKVGSATAAKGSQAHQAVYNVGKFFGAKFQPWGAVKVARAIGNAGRVVAAVGGVLAVVAQIAEDKQQEKHRLQLREARDSVRVNFRDSVKELEKSFWSQFDKFSGDFYDSEIAEIDKSVNEILEAEKKKSSESEMFNSIENDLTALIEKIQNANVEQGSTVPEVIGQALT